MYLFKTFIKRPLVLALIPVIGYNYWFANKRKPVKQLVTDKQLIVRTISLRKAHLNGSKTTNKIVSDLMKKFVNIIDQQIDINNELIVEEEGSGMFIDSKGYILTNCHVSTESPELVIYPFTRSGGDIVLNDDRAYQAIVVYVEPELDLSLIRTSQELSNQSAVKLCETVEQGQQVVAIGCPDIDYSVCDGVVYCVEFAVKNGSHGSYEFGSVFNDENHKCIASTNTISGGYSGGPLVNSEGEVVGVNFANDEPIYSCFSTSATDAIAFIDRGMKFEKSNREKRYSMSGEKCLGLFVRPFDYSMEMRIKRKIMQNFSSNVESIKQKTEGLVVLCALKTDDFSKGFELLDIIIKVNETEVKTIDELKDNLKNVENDLEMTVIRNKSIQKIYPKLSDYNCLHI